MAALRRYALRDLNAELTQWETDMESIVAAVDGIPGVESGVRFPQPNGRAVPNAHVRIQAAAAGMDANAVVRALQEGDPPIFLFERWADEGRLVFMPEALNAGDAAIIAIRLQEILGRKS
jgi:L-seryl-tRNA(Ser) seleniumtransferase/D-glucosaminate-6-phosphate ammonia-lyase